MVDNQEFWQDHARAIEASQVPRPSQLNSPVMWAFQHFFHIDQANACMHMADVKFSPITFQLADLLEAIWRKGDFYPNELQIVLFHRGRYELDLGR